MAMIGRLAMRVEGDLWVARYALPNTMDGAIFLGSIQLVIVRDLDRRQRFRDLMQEAVADMLEEHTGQRPEFFKEAPAPEQERGGNA
jgi:hypothetical protein